MDVCVLVGKRKRKRAPEKGTRTRWAKWVVGSYIGNKQQKLSELPRLLAPSLSAFLQSSPSSPPQLTSPLPLTAYVLYPPSVPKQPFPKHNDQRFPLPPPSFPLSLPSLLSFPFFPFPSFPSKSHPILSSAYQYTVLILDIVPKIPLTPYSKLKT